MSAFDSPRLRLGRGWAPALLLWVFATLVWSPAANAQASSWLYVGGGGAVLDQEGTEARGALQFDTGIGTSARYPIVAGGLFRAQAYLGEGVDLGLGARLVSRGYALGDFGFGFDAGVYQRWWGVNSTGFTGNLVLGAPWGLTFLGGASVGSGDQRIYFVSLGIDLARLTVHRHSGLDWFPNPMRSPYP